MSRHSKSTKDSFFFDRNTKLWHRVLNTVSGESSPLNDENKESDILHCLPLSSSSDDDDRDCGNSSEQEEIEPLFAEPTDHESQPMPH